MDRPDNSRVAETVAREEGRLRAFIRARVAGRQDVEDILQDVFYEFVVASRLATPIENAAAWLFRVARNRVVDLFRKQRRSEGEQPPDLLAADGGPDAAYAREVLLDEFESALAELPPEQREVFLANEFDGRSFRDLSAESGVSINTLLARKRYAVLHLRKRLRSFYE
jgi:RNA polymerase sigma factor (sigma-70 family)